jgi:hypothetical protein
MNKILRGITLLPGLLFLMVGIGWLIDPASAAKDLGMDLMTGMGLSSQMGDVGGFFMGGALMCIIGVITLNKTWLHGAALLAISAAVYRVVATLAHGADFAAASIVIEVVITAWLLFAASQIQPATATTEKSNSSEG